MTSSGQAPLSRRSVWTSQIAALIGLVAFVFLVKWANPYLHPTPQTASAQIGLLLVIIPTLLWLFFFYVQDFREPEPLHYIFGVTVLGAALAGGVAIPLIDRFYQVDQWLVPTQSPKVFFLGAILIFGAIQEFCKYFALRLSVYDNPEFDEVGDGIIYGSAAGLGFATMLNLDFVLASPRINTLDTTLRIVVTAMAQGAFGGIIGYFLGRAKIHGKKAGVAFGYLLAVGLNGAFMVILTYASRFNLFSGKDWMHYNSWNGLIIAGIVCLAVTFILFQLVRKHGAEPRISPEEFKRGGLVEAFPVWIFFLALLVGGYYLKTNQQNQFMIAKDPQGKFQVTYPQGWIPKPGSPHRLEVSDPLSGEAFPSSFIVKLEALPKDSSLEKTSRATILDNQNKLSLYRMLSSKDIQIAGKPAVAVEYSYVADPQRGILEAERIPVVVRGVEWIVISGDTIYRLDFRASNDVFARKRNLFEKLVKEVRL